MRNLILRLLTIACAVYLSGAHWLVLQGTAWTKMVAERSQFMGISEALRTTFNGENPCEMCKLVKHGAEGDNQEKGWIPKGAKLFETALEAPTGMTLSPLVATDFSHPCQTEEFPVPRKDAPPVPPPIA